MAASCPGSAVFRSPVRAHSTDDTTNHQLERELAARTRELRALARQLVGEQDADDVVQESMAIALRRPPGDPSGLSAWIRTVVRSVASNHRRSSTRRRAREVAAARPERQASTESLAQQRESVQRLLSVQSIAKNEDRTEYQSYDRVTYYFFVGHKTITQDHLKRTLIDIKDRLLYGMDQRWAYVSASMWYGEVPWIENEVTIEEADEKLRSFLKDLSVEQIDWDQIK